MVYSVLTGNKPFYPHSVPPQSGIGIILFSKGINYDKNLWDDRAPGREQIWVEIKHTNYF
jgi:hypothetical protein